VINDVNVSHRQEDLSFAGGGREVRIEELKVSGIMAGVASFCPSGFRRPLAEQPSAILHK
jgi:hypothetical protein